VEGQPELSGPKAGLDPSGQQPNKELSHEEEDGDLGRDDEPPDEIDDGSFPLARVGVDGGRSSARINIKWNISNSASFFSIPRAFIISYNSKY
jgi:hypothetical protein